MYIIIKPVKMEESSICITIAKADFTTPFYRRVFETERELYVARNRNEILYWMDKVSNLGFDHETAKNLLPMEFDIFSFEFDYETRTYRIIE